MAVFLVTNIIFGATTSQKVKTADVHYISTGNSDYILISDNGHYAMIDGANNDDEQFLVNYLNNLELNN